MQATTQIEQNAEPAGKKAHETIDKAAEHAKETTQAAAGEASQAVQKGSQNVVAKTKDVTKTAKNKVNFCLGHC